jgi:catechol 2,3-dioxygenase-like lactoylglutathione lyase family enzyme
MLEHSALIGFVGVSDLDRARQFYGDTLGLPITEESPFALVANANGTMLRLTLVEQPVAAPTRSWGGALRTSCR